MKTLLLSLMLIFFVGNLSAQTTKGQITYKMEFSSDNPDMAMVLPMMQGSTLKLYFAKDKSTAEMEMGSFMKMKSVMDAKLNKGIILTEVMGQKIANNVESISDKFPAPKESDKLIKTSETKKIIGFTCTKYVIKDKSGNGNDSTFWLTTEIKTSLVGQEQFSNKVEGVPLEFSSIQNGMNVRFEATNFSKTFDPEIFSLKIPEGYQIKTVEEMEKLGS